MLSSDGTRAAISSEWERPKSLRHLKKRGIQEEHLLTLTYCQYITTAVIRTRLPIHKHYCTFHYKRKHERLHLHCANSRRTQLLGIHREDM